MMPDQIYHIAGEKAVIVYSAITGRIFMVLM